MFESFPCLKQFCELWQGALKKLRLQLIAFFIKFCLSKVAHKGNTQDQNLEHKI